MFRLLVLLLAVAAQAQAACPLIVIGPQEKPASDLGCTWPDNPYMAAPLCRPVYEPLNCTIDCGMGSCSAPTPTCRIQCPYANTSITTVEAATACPTCSTECDALPADCTGCSSVCQPLVTYWLCRDPVLDVKVNVSAVCDAPTCITPCPAAGSVLHYSGVLLLVVLLFFVSL